MSLGWIKILLPLALVCIMLYLGLTLTLTDFARVLRRPRAVLVGLAGQMLLLPLAAFAVANIVALEPVLAVGLMVLAACPGGVSSGLLTHWARGDVALSITLTAITSLAAMLTLPLIVGAAWQYFMAVSLSASLPLAPMVRSMFLLTTLPVLLGMLLRWRYPNWVARHLGLAGKLATGLFFLIVLATFWQQRELLWLRLPSLGPAALLLNALALAGSWALAYQARLAGRDRISIVTECGLQNSALGIFVSLQLLASPAMSAPSVVYALLMNFGGVGFALLMRRRRSGALDA